MWFFFLRSTLLKHLHGQSPFHLTLITIEAYSYIPLLTSHFTVDDTLLSTPMKTLKILVDNYKIGKLSPHCTTTDDGFSLISSMNESYSRSLTNLPKFFSILSTHLLVSISEEDAIFEIFFCVLHG